MKSAIIMGTRPEIINLSPIVNHLKNSSLILSALRKTVKNPSTSTKKTPFGKGDAGKQIDSIIRRNF